MVFTFLNTHCCYSDKTFRNYIRKSRITFIILELSENSFL
ncbi:hypothetical protein LEP1GSC059_4387 [Leptospira noguchii serovar Panama str. CZ214]|uniref:Uncharacterized protein n=1 Tax=Leptospira noguchii serovar Panama str. CZ214 TaxID=1001595 RepID=T0GTD3_9LEPT|nr:hypothetical protein LEP1GSC059_4387 [Leptospira noguchii serovar Panama str. CZ214]